MLTGSGALAAESDDKVGNSKESRELQMAIPASENKEAQHPQSLRLQPTAAPDFFFFGKKRERTLLE